MLFALNVPSLVCFVHKQKITIKKYVQSYFFSPLAPLFCVVICPFKKPKEKFYLIFILPTLRVYEQKVLAIIPIWIIGFKFSLGVNLWRKLIFVFTVNMLTLMDKSINILWISTIKIICNFHGKWHFIWCWDFYQTIVNFNKS